MIPSQIEQKNKEQCNVEVVLRTWRLCALARKRLKEKISEVNGEWAVVRIGFDNPPIRNPKTIKRVLFSASLCIQWPQKKNIKITLRLCG